MKRSERKNIHNSQLIHAMQAFWVYNFALASFALALTCLQVVSMYERLREFAIIAEKMIINVVGVMTECQPNRSPKD